MDIRTICAGATIALLLCSCGAPKEETRPVRKDITTYVYASGALEAENTYTLTALTDGYLSDLQLEENQEVKKGACVGVIDNRQNALNAQGAEQLLEIAQNNTTSLAPAIKQATAKLHLITEKYRFDSLQERRYRSLLEAQSIPRARYEAVQTQWLQTKAERLAAEQSVRQIQSSARQSAVSQQVQKNLQQSLLADNRVYALETGTVIRKYKNKGDFVRKGEAIAWIGNLNQLFARVQVDENSIAQVKPGQQVLIRLNTRPDHAYTGMVRAILPEYNESRQSFLVDIQLGEQPELRVVGLQLQANIETGIAKNVLLIPRKYLNYANQVRVKGNPDPVKVEVQSIGTDWVEIKSGISDETILITNL